MADRDSSQVTEFSTHQNQSANVPLETSTFDAFTDEQDLPLFPHPPTPINTDFMDLVLPLVEEASAPSLYNHDSPGLTGLDLCCMTSYHDDSQMPIFESSSLHSLSELNSFEDTSSIILPPSPKAPAHDQNAPNVNNDDQVDKNGVIPMTPPILPFIAETASTTVVSLGSSTTGDETCIGVTATTSATKKQRRPNKIRRVICSGEGVRSPQMDVQDFIRDLGSKNFKPSIIRVDPKEDVAEKIASFAKANGPIMSIVGEIGALSVIQLLHQGNTTTFEGKFEIISFNATSLSPKEGDQHGMVRLFVEVVDEDGDIFGGLVNGKLVAESHVQFVCLTALPPTGYNFKRLKTKPNLRKHRIQTTSVDHDSSEAQVEMENHQSEEEVNANTTNGS